MVESLWNQLQEHEKEVVFKSVEEYYSVEFNSKQKYEKRAVLQILFNAYNKYSGGSYYGSAMSCGSCVNTVTGFFKKEYDKWLIAKR
tara:strand:+ start:5955 stop:6215 length:261 start_codon:yes stop_codon:yes gene_type:complete